MSSEVADLESRVKALEKEVQDIKEPLTSTLMDLRKTISELENPFNYITKFFESGIKIEDKESNKSEQKIEEVSKVGEQQVGKKSNNLSISHESKSSPWQFQLNVLVISDILVKIFGKEELKKVMGEYVKDGWIDRETAKAVEEAINKVDDKPSTRPSRMRLEDHLLALYLLYRLSSYPTDPMLPILVILLNRTKEGERSSISMEGQELGWR